jgi:hypothetical protein
MMKAEDGETESYDHDETSGDTTDCYDQQSDSDASAVMEDDDSDIVGEDSDDDKNDSDEENEDTPNTLRRSPHLLAPRVAPRTQDVMMMTIIVVSHHWAYFS